MFLIGIPGCGKTILCSTVIEHVRDLSKQRDNFGFAYFYFDFNDERKQTVDGFLSFVLMQLSWQIPSLPDGIRDLYDQNSNMSTRPKMSVLVDTLFSLAVRFKKIYVVVDALDECQNRNALAALIARINGSWAKNIHILGTSRREHDLEVAFQVDHSQSALIQSSLVDEDIALHVRSKLNQDSQLQAWPQNVKDEMRSALVKRACGMYEFIHAAIRKFSHR